MPEKTLEPEIRLTGRYVEELEEGMKYHGFIQFKVDDEDKKINFVIYLKKNLLEWTEEEKMLDSYSEAAKLAHIKIFTSEEKECVTSITVKAILLSLSLPFVLHFFIEKNKENGESIKALSAKSSSTPKVNEVFSELVRCNTLFQ